MIGNRSFSTRLSLRVLLFVSIMFLLSIGVIAFMSHKLITEEAKRSAQNVLDASISDIEKKLLPTEAKVQNIAWILMHHEYDTASMSFLVNSVAKDTSIVGSAIAFAPYAFDSTEYYYMLYAFDSLDMLCTKRLGSDSYDYFSMEWFKVPYETKKPYWSNPYFDKGGAECMMATYSYPLVDAEGTVLAIVTADITLEWIADMVSNIKPYAHSYMVVVGANGCYFDQSPGSGLEGETVYSTALRTGNDRLLQISEDMMAGNRGLQPFMNKNKASFAVYGPLHNGWAAAIICHYRDILERANRMSVILLLVSFFGLLLLFISCYRIVRRITQPITELTVSAMNMAKGNFHAQLVDVKTNDEMRRLHDAFAFMQHSINEYIDELRTTTASNERFESELNIAREIQLHMVPSNFPCRSDVDLYAMLRPAKEVGGDLYDFVIRDNKLYFTIGDVSGKGVPAAMFMSITRSSSRFISGLGWELDEVMGKINDSICDGNESNMFVTLFMGCLDLETGALKYCNGGHNPLLVIPPDEEDPYFLPQKSNIVVGVIPQFRFEVQETVLKKGTRLLLYTDGVTEAERADKAQYGNERLMSWTKENRNCEDEKTACLKLLDDVRNFTAGNEQNDDITIMSIKLH